MFPHGDFAIGKAADELEKNDPKSSEKINELMAEAEGKRLGSQMKRSENALRYRRMERAAEIQGKILADMEDMQQRMKELMEGRKGMTAGELQKELEKLVELHKKQQDPSLTPEARKKLEEEIRQQLKSLAKKMPGNQNMKGIAQQAEGLGDGESANKANQLLSKAARVIERRLFELAMQKKLKLSRSGGQKALEDYRKLVQEYFKKLSELED